MSRSPNDALAVGLGTGEIAIGRRRPAWPRRRAREAAPNTVRIVEIESERRYTDAGLLDGLARALDSASDSAQADARPRTELRAPRRAAIVLDDFWGRHAILRGDFRCMRARELDEVVGAYFADTLGVDADTLAVRWQTQPGGQTLFASALPRALIEGIRDRSAQVRVDAASLMLALPRTLNRVRAAITARNGWLFIATDTLLHAVTIDDGAWAAYDTERLFRKRFADGNSDADAIADAARQMIERSGSSHGADGNVYLCGRALDCEPLERSFARFVALRTHMSSVSPALDLMELAS